jgi:hypothetical protein
MKAIALGGGFMFRFLISGLTAFLVMSVMSMATAVVTPAGGVTGSVTGGFLQAAPAPVYGYLAAQLFVGVVTFLGSFRLLSEKKRDG